MIFYKRMIGDIQAKTGHLSLAEFGAYDRLLDHYYSTEKPIPKDRAHGIARAVSKEDRKAVDFVLSEFFTLGEDGLYRQGRTEEMIAEAQPKISAARVNGGKGGRPRKIKTETQQEPTGFLNGNPEETQGGYFSKASQSQNQNTGIHSHVAKDENSVCVDQHTQFSDEFKTVIRTARPELDAELVFANFVSHYPADKRTMAKWRQWVANERTGVAEAAHAAAQDPETRPNVEKRGIAVGIGKWDDSREQWPQYKARVVAAERQGVAA